MTDSGDLDTYNGDAEHDMMADSTTVSTLANSPTFSMMMISKMLSNPKRC